MRENAGRGEPWSSPLCGRPSTFRAIRGHNKRLLRSLLAPVFSPNYKQTRQPRASSSACNHSRVALVYGHAWPHQLPLGHHNELLRGRPPPSDALSLTATRWQQTLRIWAQRALARSRPPAGGAAAPPCEVGPVYPAGTARWWVERAGGGESTKGGLRVLSPHFSA